MGQTAYNTAVLADSPVAFYKMDEASGLPQDSSGNARHFQAANGSSTYRVNGPFSGAFAITTAASNSAFVRTGAIPTGTGDVTIEVWISYSANGDNVNPFFFNGSFGSDGFGFLLKTTGIAGIASTSFTSDGPSIRQNTWHQIVITKLSGTWKYYLDGELWLGDAGSQTITTPSSGVSFGLVGVTASVSNISLYSTSLSATRIRAHYEAAMDIPTASTNSYATEVLADSPYVYFKCDDASGNPQDSSGNGFHITSSFGLGTVTYNYEAPFTGAQSISITTTSNTKDFSRSAAINSDNVTFEGWIKVISASTDIELFYVNQSSSELGFGYNNTTKTIVGIVDTSFVTDGFNILAKNWNHIVMIRSSGNLKYYLNGELWLDIGATTFTATPSFLHLGNITHTVSPTATIAYSNMAIYNSILSATRIKAHYQAAMGTKAQQTVNPGHTLMIR